MRSGKSTEEGGPLRCDLLGGKKLRDGWTKPKAWKPKDEAYLRRFYAKLSLERLAKKLRRTPCSVKARASKLRLSKGRRYFTPEEDEMMRAYYPIVASAKLAKMLGRRLTSIYPRAHLLGLQKSAKFLASLNVLAGERLNEFGRAHRFPKGHVPANKGLRRPGYSIGRG